MATLAGGASGEGRLLLRTGPGLCAACVLSGRLPETLRRIHAQPILTVGEMEDFDQAGGMIRLRTEGSRIRFDINPKPAREAGLRFSSELLKLARIVE